MDLITTLLLLLLFMSVVNLATGFVLFWRQTSLDARVSKLEAYQQNSLTHAETRQIYERLSSIEGQLSTTNRLMQTVQEHLLEND